MRYTKKILGILCSACLTVSMMSVPALADDYSYSVTLSSGTKGSFSGGDSIELTMGYNGTINLNDYVSQVVPEEGYYVKGFHEAGSDDLAGVAHITGDTTYVVSYGKEGSQPNVTYTVRYIDAETGEELAPATTGTGFAGDQAIVSYQVIDNYMPNAYNLVMTLTADGDNEFVFEYTDISASTVIEVVEVDGEIIYVYTDEGGVTTAPGGAEGTTPGGTAEGTTPGGAEGTTPGGTEEGTTPGGTEEGTTPGGTEEGTQPETETPEEEVPELPEETIDLDEPEAPTANVQEGQEGETSAISSNIIPVVVIAIVAVAVIAFIAYVVSVKRRRRK